MSVTVQTADDSRSIDRASINELTRCTGCDGMYNPCDNHAIDAALMGVDLEKIDQFIPANKLPDTIKTEPETRKSVIETDSSEPNRTREQYKHGSYASVEVNEVTPSDVPRNTERYRKHPHAEDRMQERGITEKEINKTIKNGQVTQAKGRNRWMFNQQGTVVVAQVHPKRLELGQTMLVITTYKNA